MIRLRLASFEKSAKDLEISIVDQELLSDAVERVLKDTAITEDPKEVFQTLVNGHLIEPDLWKFTQLKTSDSVMIAPKLSSGDGALRQILTIVAIVAINTLVPGSGAALGFEAGSFGLGLTIAAYAAVAVYAINQLIPPPVVSGDKNANDSFSDSQMYSISSQANVSKKFGLVPKVYGYHKIFPSVAANPYTELETDPATGTLAQYLYMVYDFGFGPNIVTGLKIGDTPIENFTDVQYRFVDFNKPLTSEGVWDDLTSDNLLYYKGTVNTENIGVTLNADQDDGGPISGYQVTRSASENPDSLPQEIAVNLVNPQGLFAYSSTNVRVPRTIDLDVYFSKVGEDNWHPYNDLNYVNSYVGIGGDTQTEDTYIQPALDYGYQTISTGPTVVTAGDWESNVAYYYDENFGFFKGTHNFFALEGHGLTIGDQIIYNGQYVATVTNVVSVDPTTDRIDSTPFTISVIFRTVRNWTDYRQDPQVFTEVISNTTTTTLKKKAGVLGRLRISAETQEPHFSTVKFTPKANGQYKVRVTRLQTNSSAQAQKQDALTFASLTTRTDSRPIRTDKRHTFMELRIKATGQLNGAIQNLSGICQSVLDVYDPNTETWSKQPTSNPAWVYCDLLTGEVSKRPLDKSRLHMPSITEWADYCDAIPDSNGSYTYAQKRFECNFILDFKTTLNNVLNQVAGASQASLNIVDGKYGVLLDVLRTTPVQIFTVRNSSGFQSSRLYRETPDGLKVTFIDPNSEWQPNELVVYNDGKDIENSETFEDITTFGVTGVEQAYRFGRYFLAQHKLRQETITLKVDFEYLVCTRGDFVQIAHDVMRVGGTPGRVKSLVGNRIQIDEGLETDGVSQYGYVFRSNSGLITSGTLSVVSADTFDLDGALPEVGNLIIIGVTDQIVYNCIVKAISPDDNLTATLTLVEQAPEIYNIESIDTIPDYAPQLNTNVDAATGIPSEVENLAVTANTYDILQKGYDYYISLDWDSPIGAAYDIFEVYADFGKGYDLVGTTTLSDFRYDVDPGNLSKVHNFKVLAVSATGKKLSLGEVGYVTATPLSKTTPPSDVTTFYSDITGEVIQLFWERVADEDIKEYVIRFNPDLDGGWEQSTSLMRVSAGTSLIATQARIGTYLIKASDFNGNESETAAAIITKIPSLNGLNVIDTKNDFPALIGSKDRVVIDDGALILDQAVIGTPGNEQYYTEGYYYYDSLLDLGEIYSVRLQSLIRAEGLVSTDIMENWLDLASLPALYNAGSADWDVEAQYRATNELNVMDNWLTLSGVSTISGGADDGFTPWTKFIVGDATGRIFQFRLKLISNTLAVTPRVLDGEIKADMPDRVESLNNIVAPLTGYTATYSPAFAGPGTTPNVQITIENGQSGDYYQFTSKTLQGFTIVFYDKLNNAVSRQFDAQIKGYGRQALTSL